MHIEILGIKYTYNNTLFVTLKKTTLHKMLFGVIHHLTIAPTNTNVWESATLLSHTLCIKYFTCVFPNLEVYLHMQSYLHINKLH